MAWCAEIFKPPGSCYPFKGILISNARLADANFRNYGNFGTTWN